VSHERSYSLREAGRGLRRLVSQIRDECEGKVGGAGEFLPARAQLSSSGKALPNRLHEFGELGGVHGSGEGATECCLLEAIAETCFVSALQISDVRSDIKSG